MGVIKVNKEFTIVEDGITIGRFQEEKDRDSAFEKYIISEKRYGIKGETNG